MLLANTDRIADADFEGGAFAYILKRGVLRRGLLFSFMYVLANLFARSGLDIATQVIIPICIGLSVGGVVGYFEWEARQRKRKPAGQ